MTATVCNSRTTAAPPWTTPESEDTPSVMMVVHLDRFLHLATRYALVKATAQRHADSLSRKRMLTPASMRDARARASVADYEDVLSTAGSAVAARLFRSTKLVKIRRPRQETTWKAEKAQCQWTGCPKTIRTKRDMRPAEKRRKLREKQLVIPAWDTRMTASLSLKGRLI